MSQTLIDLAKKDEKNQNDILVPLSRRETMVDSKMNSRADMSASRAVRRFSSTSWSCPAGQIGANSGCTTIRISSKPLVDNLLNLLGDYSKATGYNDMYGAANFQFDKATCRTNATLQAKIPCICAHWFLALHQCLDGFR